MVDFEIIDSPKDLRALARELLKEDVIGVDTEADSFYHYFDKTCLVQIATRKNRYLVDPLAMGGPAELAPLGPVFASPKVRLIFHAAEYDIFVLKRDCGFRFSNLFDTMVSAQLLGYPAIGLAALISHHFGVIVPKDEQRSDWSRRPLRDKQLDYAAGDVRYLIRLTSKLEKELKHARRLSWAQEEFESVSQRQWEEREFDTHGHLRIKGAKKLDAKQLDVLRELYLMRDARAREIDRPTFKVLGNRTLLELASTQPKRLSDFSGVKGVTDLIVRRMGNDILAAVKNGRAAPKQPERKIPTTGNGRKRMDRRTERLVNKLKRWRATRAQELELDPGVLCPNSALEAIAWRNPERHDDLVGAEELKGWFVREFGAEVVAAVREDEPAAGELPDDPGDGPKQSAEGGGASGEPSEPSSRSSRRRKKRRRGKKKGAGAASRSATTREAPRKAPEKVSQSGAAT